MLVCSYHHLLSYHDLHQLEIRKAVNITGNIVKTLINSKFRLGRCLIDIYNPSQRGKPKLMLQVMNCGQISLNELINSNSLQNHRKRMQKMKRTYEILHKIKCYLRKGCVKLCLIAMDLSFFISFCFYYQFCYCYYLYYYYHYYYHYLRVIFLYF